MTLLDKELCQFKALYKEECDVDLTDAQALDKGTRLIRLLKVVLQAEYERRQRKPTAHSGRKA